MIECKGAYHRTKTSPAQRVLVQFDGVMLHVWHMSDPFYRILASDVFRVQRAIGKGQYYIKLPNGGTIETDDADAVFSLKSCNQSFMVNVSQGILSWRHNFTVILGTIAAIGAILFAYWIYVF